MKILKNYWFLQDPVDVEHKFYVLMDFLQSVEEDMSFKKYNEQIQKVRRISEDLKSFNTARSLSDKTLITMTKKELDKFKDLQDNLIDREKDLNDVIESSLGIISNFLEKIDPIIQEINKAINVYTFEPQKSFNDQGFLILRIPGEKKMKIYSWMFSFVKVKKKDQIGILLTELLEPLPKYTTSDKKIVSFFKDGIKVLSPETYTFVFADLDSSRQDEEIGFDLIKDKGIDFIVKSYKDFLGVK